MDIAAEIIGVNPLKAKTERLCRQLVLCRYRGRAVLCGLSGCGRSGRSLRNPEIVPGAVHDHYWRIRLYFRSSFAGAAFLVLLPVVLKVVGVDVLGWPTDIVAHLQLVIVGALIIMFLILEPHGLAQLWRVAKEKLRLWPFPH